MGISLYVANDSIHFVRGSEKNGVITVEDARKFPLPEGAVMNGVITDESLFVQGVTDMTATCPLEDEKHVRIAVGSSQIFSKTMLVPKIPEKKMLEWIQGEFMDVVAEDEEMLYDYTILCRTDEGDQALLCAVKRSIIGAYIDIFSNNFGVGIDCIDTGLNCQVKLMDEINLEDDTYITLVLEDMNVIASLYVKGVFKIANRTRMLSERGTPEMSGEIAQTISNLIQFNETEKNGETINKIYFVGARPDEDFLRNDIREGFGIDPKTLKNSTNVVETELEGFVLDDYIHAVGNLIRK